MSSLSYGQVGTIARRRLDLAPDQSLRFQPLVRQALLSLARKVARRDDYTELRTEIDITCTAGIIIISDTSILIEMLDKTGVLTINSKETKWAERYDDLRTKLPTDVYWAAMKNRKIYVKDITTGNLDATNQTGRLDASYAPTLSQLPSNYDEELLDEVVHLAKGLTDSAAMSIQEEEKPNVRIEAG